MRLPNYDYTQPGYYFVTICTYQNKNILGKIVGAGPCAGPNMILNNVGLMIKSTWMEIPRYYPNIETDEFVVMPNHIHGIIVTSNNNGRPQWDAPTLSLSDIIHRFKSFTTKRYHQLANHESKLWQRSFHDHIIRSKRSLNRIRQYIHENPLKWNSDENNPINIERNTKHDQERSQYKDHSTGNHSKQNIINSREKSYVG